MNARCLLSHLVTVQLRPLQVFVSNRYLRLFQMCAGSFSSRHMHSQKCQACQKSVSGARSWSQIAIGEKRWAWEECSGTRGARHCWTTRLLEHGCWGFAPLLTAAGYHDLHPVHDEEQFMGEGEVPTVTRLLRGLLRIYLMLARCVFFLV
jgi:hypothetical protein